MFRIDPEWLTSKLLNFCADAQYYKENPGCCESVRSTLLQHLHKGARRVKSRFQRKSGNFQLQMLRSRHQEIPSQKWSRFMLGISQLFCTYFVSPEDTMRALFHKKGHTLKIWKHSQKTLSEPGTYVVNVVKNDKNVKTILRCSELIHNY